MKGRAIVERDPKIHILKTLSPMQQGGEVVFNRRVGGQHPPEWVNAVKTGT